ncbi:DUF4184 family protein [Streptomyces sp. NPDC048254]|uniref:DUF4184 family protein n=1 Tax=Streptomyces sp. NPDC048254 TaxID=3365525 RepID=UPI0037203BCF
MPFTLSHAAAVLPAVRGDGTGRGRLVPAVLVAGSFSPDLTYYAASAVPDAMEFGAFTHSFTGVFTVDVLFSWALVALWVLVREPLVALLPRTRQGRLAALLRCGAPRARAGLSVTARWYVSAVLGALTHVVWDAFTHHDRWGTRLIPAIGRHVAGVPLYTLLQYGTSAVAAAVLGVFVLRALRRAPAGEPVGAPLLSAGDRWWAGAGIAGCALLAAVQQATRFTELRRVAAPARVVAGDGRAYWGSTAKPWELLPTVLFGAGAGLLLGVLGYAVAVRVWRPAPVADGVRRSPSAVR